MSQKLESNRAFMKTKRQQTANNATYSHLRRDTMNSQKENYAMQYPQSLQMQHVTECCSQSLQENKNRINPNVKHPRAKTCLRSFNMFPTKYKQKQDQHQRQLCKLLNWLLLATIIASIAIIENSVSLAEADENVNGKKGNFSITTTQMPLTTLHYYNGSSINSPDINASTFAPIMASNESLRLQSSTNPSPPTIFSSTTTRAQQRLTQKYNTEEDSIFLRFAKRFTADNNLWSGIIQDCYRRPTFACFQKNVYYYLSDVLDAQDVNVTHRLQFYKNDNSYQYDVEESEDARQVSSTQSSMGADSLEDESDVEQNEIPYEHSGHVVAEDRPIADTPIEEVTNALYGKSIKFAMTHDIELKLPEMMFDGATFRISPQAIEGNGVIAKMELIPKQQSEARLAGKFLMKKIQKILRSKLLLSFLALVLIIKIIKIKLFWLLPLVIGVGAAKKLLLKFLLFLFPALSHLFKLCSYYQQTYHSTKYHHHHHHINHHHTIVPPWHNAESAHIPEIIYTHPPKGHVSAYLHGAPIHENHGPQSHEHFETGWANSGPGLGSDFISDINRVAQVDDNTDFFKPHSNNDANELHGWGLGTTPISTMTQNKNRPQNQQLQNPNQIQKPPTNHLQQPQSYQKPQATGHTFNPFLQPGDTQSFFSNKYRNGVVAAQSAPSPVYTPARHPLKSKVQQPLSQAAQIAALYDPTRSQPQISAGQTLQPQTQLTPELSAQLKEAIRIQAEQRLVRQQQKILDKQPFVHDGQPLMPLNYDPFYSPILLKIDKIIEQLGVTDDLCKERLICSMYKDPQRYTPHSNFVSAELSRDINELQPIKNTNQAVKRFFNFIQAARDGQDQKDCLTLYPSCSVNTE